MYSKTCWIRNVTKAKKHTSNSDKRFNLDDTPITSPWRSYNRFNKYDESFPITAYEAFNKGKTEAQVARLLDCSVPTMRKWAAEIEDFGQAYEVGRTNQLAEMDDKFQEHMVAEDFETPLPEINTKLFELYAKSHFPEKYNPNHVDNTGQTGDKNQNDGTAALLDLLNKTDRISISASNDAKPDGTPAQTLSIEKQPIDNPLDTGLKEAKDITHLSSDSK